MGGLLWVWVLIFALYFGADLCTPYHCVSPCNLQSYIYISSALCAHSSTMKSAYTTNLTSSTILLERKFYYPLRIRPDAVEICNRQRGPFRKARLTLPAMWDEAHEQRFQRLMGRQVMTENSDEVWHARTSDANRYFNETGSVDITSCVERANSVLPQKGNWI